MFHCDCSIRNKAAEVRTPTRLRSLFRGLQLSLGTEAANTRSGAVSADRARQQAERTTIARKLEGLYDAIAEGLRTPGLKSKLEDLEARLAELDKALSAPAPSAVRLHPNLSEVYRRKVTELAVTLSDPDIRTKALETIRGLIASVTVRATADGITLELEGALSAMVGFAQGGTTKSPLESGLGVGSVEVVAGACNHLKLRLLSAYRALLERSALARSRGLLRSAA